MRSTLLRGVRLINTRTQNESSRTRLFQAVDMLQKDARRQSFDQKQIACEVRERLVPT